MVYNVKGREREKFSFALDVCEKHILTRGGEREPRIVIEKEAMCIKLQQCKGEREREKK